MVERAERALEIESGAQSFVVVCGWLRRIGAQLLAAVLRTPAIVGAAVSADPVDPRAERSVEHRLAEAAVHDDEDLLHDVGDVGRSHAHVGYQTPRESGVLPIHFVQIDVRTFILVGGYFGHGVGGLLSVHGMGAVTTYTHSPPGVFVSA